MEMPCVTCIVEPRHSNISSMRSAITSALVPILSAIYSASQEDVLQVMLLELYGLTTYVFRAVAVATTNSNALVQTLGGKGYATSNTGVNCAVNASLWLLRGTVLGTAAACGSAKHTACEWDWTFSTLHISLWTKKAKRFSNYPFEAPYSDAES